MDTKLSLELRKKITGEIKNTKTGNNLRINEDVVFIRAFGNHQPVVGISRPGMNTVDQDVMILEQAFLKIQKICQSVSLYILDLVAFEFH